MAITGQAQHAAWQRREVPPVEQLRPDLWSIPVPLPRSPLRYVSVYAFTVPGGLGLVDAGWDSAESWAALTDGLAGIGASVADVRGIVVTHLHFDHLGLAGRVREASGAWIAMHPADADPVARMSAAGATAAVDAEVDFLVSLGASRPEAAFDVGTPEHFRPFVGMAVPDRRLEDGELADFPGWSLRAVHTPGHTAGHLCLAEERTGLFLAGDHVLPRITPNISTVPGGAADPLGDYLGSLAAVRDRVATEVLPAHEWRFTGLAERVDAIAAHHEHRLAELLAAVTGSPGATAWDLAGLLTWSRPWDQYERRMRIFAVTETDAHLRLLASRGRITGARSDGDGAQVTRWTVA